MTQSTKPGSKTEKFLSEYDIDREIARRFKRRKKVRKLLGDGIAILAVLLLILLLALFSEYQTGYTVNVLGALVFSIIAILGIVDIFVAISIWNMDCDSELVGLYELQMAFSEFCNQEDTDDGRIIPHLEKADSYLVLPSVFENPKINRLAGHHRRGVSNYVSAIKSAKDQEKQINETFPDLIRVISEVTTNKNDSDINDIANKIDQVPVDEPGRLKSAWIEGRDAFSKIGDPDIFVVLIGVIVFLTGYHLIGLAVGGGLGAFTIAVLGRIL